MSEKDEWLDRLVEIDYRWRLLYGILWLVVVLMGVLFFISVWVLKLHFAFGLIIVVIVLVICIHLLRRIK